MMRHSNDFAVSKRHTKRQLNAASALSSLIPFSGSSPPASSITSTDSTSPSAASANSNTSPAAATANAPTTGNGPASGNAATTGNAPATTDSLTPATGPLVSDGPPVAAGTGSTTSSQSTGSTASTDPTKGSGSKASTGTTTVTGSTTGTTDPGATTGLNKSGSLNSSQSLPLIPVNSPNPPSNQSTAPASQAPKASSTPVANAPTVAGPGVNQSGSSLSPTVTTSTNPAGVVVTKTLYPSAQPIGANSDAVKAVSAPRSSATPSASDDNTGTSVGTVMGILVAGLIGAVILIGVVGMFFKRKKRRMNNEYDDNPFLNDKYGPDADMGRSPSVDSHGLARSGSGTNRTGGVTGPRPPSILERHWGAPSLPPPPPAFQPGQTYCASQFAPSSQFNPVHNPYSSPQNDGYAPEHLGCSDGGHEAEKSAYGGHYSGPLSSHTAYEGEVQPSHSSNTQREPSPTNNFSPASFDAQAYGHASSDDSKETYTAQVAQKDFFGGGRLKNPYDCDETIRSGTPVQPNIQQSYFAHSYPDSFGNSPNAPRQTQPHEFRDQRTLSVINGYPSTPVGIPITL